MLFVCTLSKGHSFFSQVCWACFAVRLARNYRVRFPVDSIWRMAGTSHLQGKLLALKTWC